MTQTSDITESQIQAQLELLRKLKQSGAAAKDCQTAATETFDIWGPAAERLNLKSLQHEMLDLAVELAFPEDYRNLKKLLLESEIMCETLFKTFCLPLRAMLDDLGIEYEIIYRMKSVYSIWRKMRVQNKEFDDMYDLFAVRIIYKTPSESTALSSCPTLESDPKVLQIKQQTLSEMNCEKLCCWRIYSVITALYRIQTDRVKNWIDSPKESGYQALHLTVMGPDCNWIEVQIRSQRMDEIAEHGEANHAKYKGEYATM